MSKFRSVELPSTMKGRLFLHSMLGRYEPLESSQAWLKEANVSKIISLAPLDEIEKKSPDYASAIEGGDLNVDIFPIPDFGVAEEEGAFFTLAHSIANWLQAGTHVLIHCGAGIGRTGTLACCVLLAGGLDLEAAKAAVANAKAGPETSQQVAIVERFEQTTRA